MDDRRLRQQIAGLGKRYGDMRRREVSIRCRLICPMLDGYKLERIIVILEQVITQATWLAARWINQISQNTAECACSSGAR